VQLVNGYNTSPIAIGGTPTEGFVIKRNEYIMLDERIIGNLKGNYHVHLHGLIHDGRFQACQSCLFGLMYALRVNVHS
jgi:hypothetical protein